MNEDNLVKYYNKFNEDKRLNSRHGQVEFITTIKYINEFINNRKDIKILDIGAGTGRYSIYFANKGFDVTAVELVKHNIRVIEEKNKSIKTILGNATNLSMLKDDSFDITLLFGPLYHLISEEDKIKALSEAKRVTKKDGIIMCCYIMNEYAIIKYGFIENNIVKCINENLVDSKFHIRPKETDLYSYVRLEDIDSLNKKLNLKRIKIVTQDGPANYIRKTLNKMDEKTFNTFLNYHLSTCERKDLLAASAHILDIVKK